MVMNDVNFYILFPHLTPATSEPNPEPVTSISVAALYSSGEAAWEVGVLAALKVKLAAASTSPLIIWPLK